MSKLLIIGEGDKRYLTFEELLLMYRPLIRKRIYSFSGLNMEVDDRYQIASIGLWRAYEKYDINIGIGFGLLAINIIDNDLKGVLAKERTLKRSKYVQVSIDRIIEDEHDEENSIINALESDCDIEEDTIIRGALKEFINRLTSKQKESIALFMRGNTYKEVAELLNVKPNTISMRMTAAKKTFSECMAG